MMLKGTLASLAVFAGLALAPSGPARAADAICYNCPRNGPIGARC